MVKLIDHDSRSSFGEEPLALAANTEGCFHDNGVARNITPFPAQIHVMGPCLNLDAINAHDIMNLDALNHTVHLALQICQAMMLSMISQTR